MPSQQSESDTATVLEIHGGRGSIQIPDPNGGVFVFKNPDNLKCTVKLNGMVVAPGEYPMKALPDPFPVTWDVTPSKDQHVKIGWEPS